MVPLGIFSVVPPTEPCALRSTQPLKVSTRDFSWGKGGRYFWLTTYHHPCSAEMSRKSGALIYPGPIGPPRPVAGDLYFTFSWFYYKEIIENYKLIIINIAHNFQYLTLIFAWYLPHTRFCVIPHTTKGEAPVHRYCRFCPIVLTVNRSFSFL